MSVDVEMSGGVPSEMDHPTKSLDNDSLFGKEQHLALANTTAYTSSPAMKATLSPLNINSLKRGFEESNDMWERVDTTMEWDMRSPENIELEELDDMFDDF